MKWIFSLMLAFWVCAVSCREREQVEHSEEPEIEPKIKFDQSKKIVAEFPLMPFIEKMLWEQLIAAEVNNDTAEAEKIVAKLRERHPFHNDESSINLGGIVYDKKTKRIEIPAKVNYPVEGDERHPGELELILCSETGRTHETLFVTECRPLHLELILHLAGYKSGSEFKVIASIPNQPPIPVEDMILLESNKRPNNLVWEFKRNSFQPLYQPDQTGDFIICWHAHESVLQVTDRGIADGVTKLKVKRDPELKLGMELKLLLTPYSGSE